MDGVRGDVGVGDEDGKLDEPDSQGCERVVGLLQRAEIDRSAGLLVVGKAFLEEDAGEEASDDADETNDADSPTVADDGGRVEDDQWEDDASDTSSGAGDSCG